MLSECKNAFVKMGVGVALIVASLIFVLLGRTEHFGYLDDHVIIAAAVALVLIVIGASWIAGYYKCLQDIGRP